MSRLDAPKVRALLLAACLGGCDPVPSLEQRDPSADPEVTVDVDTPEARAQREREAAEIRARAEAEAAARSREEAERRVEEERLAFERAHPMHGVTYHFLGRIYAEPSDRGRVIGYMRRGTTFRATERMAGRGCERGWHRLSTGGFVCRGDGFLLGTTPQTFTPSPLPARLADALPYPYAYTSRRSVPQYYRVPTPEEEALVATIFERLDAEQAQRADGGVPTEQEAPPPDESPDGGVPMTDGGVPATPDDGLPDYVRMRMLRGFYVSVDGTEGEGDRAYVRTVRGAYVRESALTPNDPPAHRGVLIGGSWQLPIAFVYRAGAHKLVRDTMTDQLRDTGPMPQHTPFVLADTVTRGATRYFASDEGWLVRDTAARVGRLRARPERVEQGAKWIHIDLSEQVLVAYVGDVPVFVTTVSTGREGFETPTGTFRIQAKHVSTTMDDLASGDEAYSIEDVPWTMFFEGSYALHGAFWHGQFGRVRSHGCVNLAPADARWLFNWSTPTTPEGWHGVFATPRNPGTYVVIEP